MQRLVGATWNDWLTVAGTATTVNAARDLPGTQVTWRVLATNAIGNSLPSSSANYAIAPIRSSAVQNVVVSATSITSQVSVSFAAPANLGGAPLIAYYLQVSKDNGTTWLTLGSTSGLSATVSAPAKSITWQYRVQASTAAGLGDPSNVASYTGH